jgi:hypothetical protein
MFEPMFYRSNWLNLKIGGGKRWFYTSFLLFALFFPFLTKSAPTIFFDNFEDYNLGNLSGQNNWQEISSSNTDEVVNTLSHTGQKSVFASSTTSNGNIKIGNVISTGEDFFWFYLTSNTFSGSYIVGGYDYNGGLRPHWRLDFVNCGVSFCTLRWGTDFIGANIIGQYSTNTWHSGHFKWQKNDNNFQFAYKIDEVENWSDWHTSYYSGTADYLDKFGFVGGGYYLDDISDDNSLGGIEITSPPNDSDISQSFSFEGTYDKQGGDYNKLMIILEQWNASSTCPLADTSEKEQEENKGWFIYQSLPFFSNNLLTKTGDFISEVNDLRTGYYNCARCYFINEITGIISDEQCRGYKINVIEGFNPYLPPYNLPFESWDTYYSAHTDKYATSTPLFSAISSAISPLADRIGNFVVYIKTYFDLEQASTKGTAMGQSIPIARGYLTEINNFFGGLPISDFLIFYILSVAVIICYKVIYRVIRLIKP